MERSRAGEKERGWAGALSRCPILRPIHCFLDGHLASLDPFDQRLVLCSSVWALWGIPVSYALDSAFAEGEKTFVKASQAMAT